ncbi:MAG TPA: prefoldin subunit alpha [Candidatus Nanoarchaeia archaeon]|nr:prefoldin subunit alpha [Candidatus Nanoarchaeia archaeon]
MNENQKKEIYFEYQLLTQHVQQMQQTLEQISQEMLALRILKNNLIELKGNKGETFIPLGHGVFVKGNLNDSYNVFMNVGSDICIEKTNEEAQKIIETQVNEVVKVIENLDEEIGKSAEKLQELEEKLR